MQILCYCSTRLSEHRKVESRGIRVQLAWGHQLFQEMVQANTTVVICSMPRPASCLYTYSA